MSERPTVVASVLVGVLAAGLALSLAAWQLMASDARPGLPADAAQVAADTNAISSIAGPPPAAVAGLRIDAGVASVAEPAPPAAAAVEEPALAELVEAVDPVDPVEAATTIDASVIALQVVEPKPVPVTVGELYQALTRSPWPESLHDEVVRIARCESRRGAGVDAAAQGDSGRAMGVLQVRVDAHPRLARSFNLTTLDGVLAGAYVVYLEAGRSFAPWSCA